MFKDLPEGQTHYENDGCGESAHNSTSETEQLEEKISLVIAQSAPFSLVPLWKDADFDHLKKGILELLTSHHNQLLDRVMEELGPEQDMRLSILGGASPGKVQGYNMCLSQSKEVIKSLKV